MWIMRSEYNLLKNTCEYWRQQYEKERARADKLVNNLLQTNGLPPASVLDGESNADHAATPEAKTKLKAYMAELFQSEITDKLDEEEPT